MTVKEKIVCEYSAGGIGLGGLSRKYGVPKSTIRGWVAAHKSGPVPAEAPLEELISLAMATKIKEEGMPGEIALLRKQLEEERLRTKLLTAIIDIAERDLKIPIKKKYGTKQ